MNFFKRLWGHTKTITGHRHKVFIHCIKAGIFWQGLTHDLSKYSPAEFIPGVRYFQGYRSPNEGEREDVGYSKAWMHHKGRNRHHYEYWFDYDSVTKMNGPVPMPIKYVKEMFCDRVAASKIYQKKKYTDASALEYYNHKKDHREIHPETAKILEELLIMLKEKGERETFAFVKRLK